MAGQFDKYLQQEILQAGVESDAVEPAKSTRGPIIPPGAVAAPGLALDAGSPLVRGTDTGGPANAASVPGVAVAATKRKKDLNTAAAGSAYREKTRARSKEQRAGLATTTMRMVNGQAVDMDEVKPPKSNPVSNLLSKGFVKPGKRPVGPVTEGMAQGPFVDPTSAERAMDPNKESREAKYTADAAQESTRQDMLSGERAFNESQAKSGGNLRSLNGITYDATELEASRQQGLKGGTEGGFDSAKYREYEKDSDFLNKAASKNDVIPASPYSKPAVDPKNQDDYRAASVTTTADKLEDLGNSQAVEDEDVDNYESRGKDKAPKKLSEDSDYKAEQARIAAEKEKNTEDSEEDKLLTAQGQADVKKTRAEKGQRNAKPVKVDSRTVPFDQQDLWDEEGNVRPEYQEGPSSTTMVAKKTHNLQPLYKSPELQAAHEKRQAYSAKVESSISDSLNKHIDTNYASPEESRAAFATLQKKHAKLRSDVDKYHPVPEGGYFNPNVNNDTTSTSYEEMAGVKTLPKPQQQNAKDDSNVVPERYLNEIDTTSDAQLAADDRNAVRNRTAVAATSSTSRTRQLDYNKIAGRESRGRTPETTLADLSKAAARNQELEKSGKKLNTHSDAVMLRARIAAKAAGVSEEVRNSPTFHQHPQGRSFVRDAYLSEAASIGDDADSQAKMIGFTGKNENEANDRKEAAYSFLQNRERFNNSSAPGTGYRYNAGLGNLDIKNDHFKTSTGDIVPMSQTEHPEHPGFDLEGSHVGFQGVVRSGQNEDGTPAYEPLKHAKTGDYLHEGWHPYKYDGRRVFEKHSIPTDAIHYGDIAEQGIQTGEGPSATIRKMSQGKESEITANGLAINQQPAAPIKGAGGFKAQPLPEGPDLSGVPVSQGEGLPRQKLGKKDEDTYLLGLAHNKHEETGTIAHGCKACSLKASQASRDSAANIAGTFIPPTSRRGVGTADNSVRPLSDAEKDGKKAAPTTDDSKSKVFAEGRPVSEPTDIAERLKVGPKTPKFELQHGSLEDISAAHAAGHIEGDEAYELAANAGYFKGAKPQYTKDPE